MDCCSVAQLCLTLCDLVDCSTPGFHPSLSPGVYSNSCPSSQWCHPAISSSATPFSFCPQSVMWIKGGKGIRRDQEGYHGWGRLWKTLAATLWGDAACAAVNWRGNSRMQRRAEGTRMRALALAVILFTQSTHITFIMRLSSRKAFLVWNKMSSPGAWTTPFWQKAAFHRFLHSGLCQIRGPLTHQMLLLSRCATYYQAGQTMGKQDLLTENHHQRNDGFCVSSVAQLCPTLCNPTDCSTPGLPVHPQLPEFTQTHVHDGPWWSVMPSNHLILCRPLLLPPSVFPSIRVFSSGLCVKRYLPKYDAEEY